MSKLGIGLLSSVITIGACIFIEYVYSEGMKCGSKLALTILDYGVKMSKSTQEECEEKKEVESE